MKKIKSKLWWMTPVFIISALMLHACSSGGGGGSRNVSYRIQISNLTGNQPFSPAAFVFHTSGYAPWMTGSAPSTGLEILAESGDGADFLSEAAVNPMVLDTTMGQGIISPGGNDDNDIVVQANADLRLSFASMLVNTNDAFTGIIDALIGNLSINESITVMLPAYDAGSEINSETAASIPGPAAGGEGYNPEQMDSGFVAIHAGVVTAADGLVTSALDESHRWLNPVARLVITRTQ